MRRNGMFLFAATLAFATAAGADALEEAKQALVRMAPAHCDLLMMKFEARTLPADSLARAQLAEKFYRRGVELEHELAPDVRIFESASAALSAQQLEELTLHSHALLQECTRKASEQHGVHVPVPVTPRGDPPKAVPYRGPSIQRQSPGRP